MRLYVFRESARPCNGHECYSVATEADFLAAGYIRAEQYERLRVDAVTYVARNRDPIGDFDISMMALGNRILSAVPVGVELSSDAPPAVQSVMLAAYATATAPPLESAGEKKEPPHDGMGGGDEDGYDMTGASRAVTHRDVRNFLQVHSARLGKTATTQLMLYIGRAAELEGKVAELEGHYAAVVSERNAAGEQRDAALRRQLTVERERDELKEEREREDRWLREVVVHFRREGLSEVAGILAARLDTIADARAAPPQQPSPSPSGAPTADTDSGAEKPRESGATLIMAADSPGGGVDLTRCFARTADDGKSWFYSLSDTAGRPCAKEAHHLDQHEPAPDAAEAGDRPKLDPLKEARHYLDELFRQHGILMASNMGPEHHFFHELLKAVELLASRRAGGER